MKQDLRNVIATALGIYIVLTGATYAHRSIAEIGRAYEEMERASSAELKVSRLEIQHLKDELTRQHASQITLEQQLVQALEAAGRKAEADAAAAKLAQAQEDSAAEKEAAQRLAEEQARADAQAATLEAERLAEAKAAALRAQQIAEATAQADATARAKALADAQAAAEVNAVKPSRRTSAS